MYTPAAALERINLYSNRLHAGCIEVFLLQYSAINVVSMHDQLCSMMIMTANVTCQLTFAIDRDRSGSALARSPSMQLMSMHGNCPN